MSFQELGSSSPARSESREKFNPDTGGSADTRASASAQRCHRVAANGMHVPPAVILRDGFVLDRVEAWYGQYLRVSDDADLKLLTVWTIGTHLASELYTSPRLLFDSTMPGSGKTTALDHLSRLACNPIQAATLSSPAQLPRLLENGIRTILLDEVDRSLRPDKPGVADLIGILNSGYCRGATRPVLVPTKGGGWEVREMPTFAPVAMAGNSPNLPDDTQSRALRILLMPDLDGTIEDSDWEFIEDAAAELRFEVEAFADAVRDEVAGPFHGSSRASSSRQTRGAHQQKRASAYTPRRVLSEICVTLCTRRSFEVSYAGVGVSTTCELAPGSCEPLTLVPLTREHWSADPFTGHH
jgi:hypothetical protein